MGVSDPYDLASLGQGLEGGGTTRPVRDDITCASTTSAAVNCAGGKGMRGAFCQWYNTTFKHLSIGIQLEAGVDSRYIQRNGWSLEEGRPTTSDPVPTATGNSRRCYTPRADLGSQNNVLGGVEEMVQTKAVMTTR